MLVSLHSFHILDSYEHGVRTRNRAGSSVAHKFSAAPDEGAIVRGDNPPKMLVFHAEGVELPENWDEASDAYPGQHRYGLPPGCGELPFLEAPQSYESDKTIFASGYIEKMLWMFTVRSLERYIYDVVMTRVMNMEGGWARGLRSYS